MLKGILICEGELGKGGVYTFETQYERDAFARGAQAGAGNYGAGSCYLATPETVNELEESVELKAQILEAFQCES